MEQFTSIFPRRWRILSGSLLKLLAALTMLIDHIAFTFPRLGRIVLITVGQHTLTLYQLMRYVGRLSFPLFCFLLVEGFLHTRDRRRYGVGLLVFALVSEIPWNLWHGGWTYFDKQNVLFTLLLGYLAMCALVQFAGEPLKQCGLLAALLAAAALLRADYGIAGFGFILLLYLLRRYPAPRSLLGFLLLPTRWAAGMSFLPINLYSGERGFVRGRVMKYAFYAFYPVHILALWALKTFAF